MTAGVVILIALFGVVIHVGLHRVLVELHYNDFGKFYYSARAAADGRAMYGPSPATAIPISTQTRMQFWNMNPPHFQAVLLPLTWLPIGAAYAVWMSINVVVAFAAVRAASRSLGRRPTWHSVLFVLFGAPTLATTVTGQMTGLMFAMGVWIWLDLRSERWMRAGVAVGLACSVKPFLAPVVVFLVIRRQWRAAAVSIATALACFAAGMAVFGLQAHVDWVRALRDVSWEWATMNALRVCTVRAGCGPQQPCAGARSFGRG